MKTVRFAQVVDHSGTPEPYTLWTAPEKDPEFQRAVKSDRVMSVHQENTGSKKDFGIVGFSPDPLAQWLIFPKSLKGFEGRRVVGVKYDLLKDAAGNSGAPTARARKKLTEFPVFAKPPSHPIEVDDDSEPKPTRSRKTKTATAPPANDALLKEVRRALKELKQGKAVAAYQRLEKAAATAAEKRRADH